MSKLDRYVALSLVRSYLATTGFLVVLFVGLDMVTRMDQYTSAARAANLDTVSLFLEVFRYELLSIPFMFVRIAPFVAVISAMFALTKLMSNNEVVPMLFTGRSLARVLWPVLVMGALSGLAMGATWQWVLPALRTDHAEARMFMRGRQEGPILSSIAIREPRDPAAELFCLVYRSAEKRMENVVFFKRYSSAEVSEYTSARSATWDPDARDWRLVDGRRRVSNESVVESPPYLGVHDITPELILQSNMERQDTMLLGYSELLELIRLRGDRLDYVLALNSHITFPLANLILMLLALPFALKFERSQRTVSVSVSIVACASYLVFDLTCQSFVFRGLMHPIIGAWSPTIVFGSLGIVLFGSLRS